MKNENLAKIKEIELEILNYFIDICERHHLTYYLFYGTLLGCIRHKGFIPWDDDIDVVMPPDDYVKFLKIMEKGKSNKYYLQNINNTKYCTFIFSKIRKYHTTMVETELNYLPFKKGLNIDVFPLLRYPKGRFKQILFMYRLRLAALLVNRDLKGKTFKDKMIYYLLHLFPRSLINHIVSKKMNKLLAYNGDYDEYRIVHYTSLDKNWFNPKVMTFEKQNVIVPEEYDKVLTKLYGDYMTPPKESERIGHGKGNLILSFTKDYDEL